MNGNNHTLEHNPTNSVLSVLGGILVGGAAGAVTMLLLAPQSGKATRAKIKIKSIELRDRANDAIEETVAQVRSEQKKLAFSSRRKAKELVKQGQTLVADQLEHISEAAQAGKKAIENA